MCVITRTQSTRRVRHDRPHRNPRTDRDHVPDFNWTRPELSCVTVNQPGYLETDARIRTLLEEPTTDASKYPVRRGFRGEQGGLSNHRSSLADKGPSRVAGTAVRVLVAPFTSYMNFPVGTSAVSELNMSYAIEPDTRKRRRTLKVIPPLSRNNIY